VGPAPRLPPPGFRLLPGHLPVEAQRALLAEVLATVELAGWFRPTMPRTDRPFSIAMCSLGPLGWVSDVRGYRYEPCHPATGLPWPPIPRAVLALWEVFGGFPHPPVCRPVNLYRGDARLGLHRDEDEREPSAPVVSVSLGDTALFRLGGLGRRDPTRSLRLASGDVVVLGGAARLAYHGIDRVIAGSSTLVPGGGRVNLTIRRVTPAFG